MEGEQSGCHLTVAAFGKYRSRAVQLVQVQLAACLTLLGPANGSLQPAKTNHPNFDALTFNQVTSGFDTEPSIREVPKRAMHDGTIAAGDCAWLAGWNAVRARRIGGHSVAPMVRYPT
jgi:hypothetical protein